VSCDLKNNSGQLLTHTEFPSKISPEAHCKQLSKPGPEHFLQEAWQGKQELGLLK